jgi:hypothetical protein
MEKIIWANGRGKIPIKKRMNEKYIILFFLISNNKNKKIFFKKYSFLKDIIFINIILRFT